ncbi:MAG: hypothetical protein Barrevirus10_9 [Barrevirus sp.]|uniref:Uncharacterized protein n=1 Tax=Barrevirus sp. TaxID=2487763 RepID=A0A3G4ZTZ3_9VIRU|nr:MAG: hypothetical protein Barrevirus10_9 [Barrevirus sp.]
MAQIVIVGFPRSTIKLSLFTYQFKLLADDLRQVYLRWCSGYGPKTALLGRIALSNEIINVFRNTVIADCFYDYLYNSLPKACRPSFLWFVLAVWIDGLTGQSYLFLYKPQH